MSIFSKEMLMGGDNKFERPNLTANGTMGGSAFAVSASAELSPNWLAYKAVDNLGNSYWWANTDRPTFTFYNPDALNVTELILLYESGHKVGPRALYGSNDGSNFTQITMTTSNYGSLGVLCSCATNTAFYKYHRLDFRSATNMYLDNLKITATIQ